MTKKTILSGIQPSGQLSLGNYLGAIKHFVNYQNTHDAYYCIVDLHAITVRQEPKELRENSYALAAWYLAAGLNPEKCAIFIQSHVTEHAELGWILGTFTQMGELERMTQFKDKALRHKQNINAGLFTYPSLMAADILLYHAHEVPVGHDQKQHLELARDIAQRFNGIYGDVFTVPKPLIPKVAARLKDLQHPEKKMSKSSDGGGTIFLNDPLKTVEKKIKRAVTDNEMNIAYNEEKQAGLANLLGIYAACEDKPIEDILPEFTGKGYGDLKKAVAEKVVATLEPIQNRYNELMNDKSELDKILQQGAEKARAKASATLNDVKKEIGFVLP
jgi:tryptophanyl-tRNA synthetase